jgi:hypothetical protein
VRAKEIAGEDLSILKTLEYNISFHEGIEPKLLKQKRKAIFSLGKGEYIADYFEFASNDEERIEALRTMYRHRDPFFVELLSRHVTARVLSMPEHEWQSILEDIYYDQLDVGPFFAKIRRPQDMAALGDKAVRMSSDELALYSGTYRYPNGQELVFVVDNGRLIRVNIDNPKDRNVIRRTELTPITPLQFEFTAHMDLNYTFRESEEKIVGVEFNDVEISYKRVGEKISSNVKIYLPE